MNPRHILATLAICTSAAAAPPIEEWKPVAAEGEMFATHTSVMVRYGVADDIKLSVRKRIQGAARCDALTFTDPAPGRAKSCMVNPENRAPGVAAVAWTNAPAPAIGTRLYIRTKEGAYGPPGSGWLAGKQERFVVAGLIRGQSYTFCARSEDAAGVESVECSNEGTREVAK